MGRKRIVFADWLATIRKDGPFGLRNADEKAIESSSIDASQVVRHALLSLTETERAVVEGYHFMGQAPSEIAKELLLTPKRVESALRTGEEKLKVVLQEYASQRWGITPVKERRCPICESPARAIADEIIRAKPASATWRPIIARLRSELGIIVATPQTLIGHRAYHMLTQVVGKDSQNDNAPSHQGSLREP